MLKMISVLNTVGSIFILITGFIAAAIYLWFKYAYTYWRRRGVKGPKPSFPEGNFQGIFTKKKHASDPIQRLYEQYKTEKYCGLYSLFRPILMVNDLELIKNILIKDFENFDSHGGLENESIDPFSSNLFTASGHKWKDARTKLSPIFTSGKMKAMTDIMLGVQSSLISHLRTCLKNSDVVDFKNTFALYTTDIIGNCAYGIECNSFNNPESKFVKYGKEGIMPTRFREQLGFLLGFVAPELAELFGIGSQNPEMVRFFTELVCETVKYREENNVKRNDLLQLLIQLKNDDLLDDNGNPVKQSNDSRFTTQDMVAQAFIFFVAGYETSSSAASYALYELASRPHLQQRARQEIRDVLGRHDGRCTYDAVQGLDYLGMIIDETLRMHPALNFLFRKCTKPYKMPDSNLKLEKDTLVYIPVIGIHMDPKIYPDPTNFDPERFSREQKSTRHKCAYIPFGDGPRICIGLRFAMLQMRLALMAVLKDYEVSICEKTQVPPILDVASLVTAPKDGVFLRVKKVL